MKIAYCIFGHLRTFKSNPSLIANLIGPNPGDIFIHTYHVMNTPNPVWHGDNLGHNVEVTRDDIHWICDTYPNVRAIEISKRSGGDEYAPPEFKKVGGSYSRHRANALRQEHEWEYGTEYDLVFNARFDLFVFEQVKLPKPATNVIYGSHYKGSKEKPLDGDVFNFAEPETMSMLVADPFPTQHKAVVEQCGFEGEQLLTAVRISCGFEYTVFPMAHGLLRNGGVMRVA